MDKINKEEMNLFEQIFFNNLNIARDEQLKFMKEEYENNVEKFKGGFSNTLTTFNNLELNDDILFKFFELAYDNIKNVKVKTEAECSVNLVCSCIDKSLHNIEINLEKDKKYNLILMVLPIEENDGSN